MPDNDTRSNNGRGAVRLENDRICVFERNGVYQARIRTEANHYLWRSLKTRNQTQAISAADQTMVEVPYDWKTTGYVCSSATVSIKLASALKLTTISGAHLRPAIKPKPSPQPIKQWSRCRTIGKRPDMCVRAQRCL